MTDIFASRRERFMNEVGDDVVVVISSARLKIRNSDVDYDFRQDSDFYYLTGFDEPDSVLVLRPGAAEERYVLFVRPRDAKAETWTGRRAGAEGVVERFGADAGFEIGDLDKELGRLLQGCERLGYTVGVGDPIEGAVLKAARLHRTKARATFTGPDIIFDVRARLAEARLIKMPDELPSLRKAAAITSEAHHEAMRLVRPGCDEYHLHAAIEYVFRSAGSARIGYGSIIASADNATILHYTENRRTIGDNELVLIDAGAEVDYLTADVTRTFPSGGRFTPEQRAVYEIVLDAELQSIAACTDGRSYIDTHNIAIRVLTEGMVDLGLLEGDVDELIAEEKFKPYYMHRTGHWLGMDVHDVGLYNLQGEPRPLKAGMVTTIEPGIYIPIDDEDAPEALRGIGVRIEDDVLVTEGEPEVLTADCVKSMDDVEAMGAESPRWVRPVDL